MIRQETKLLIILGTKNPNIMEDLKTLGERKLTKDIT